MTVISRELSSKIANMGFVCACLVVFIHCVPPEVANAGFGSIEWCVFQFWTQTVCRIAVPVFFSVSGFLLAGHIDETHWWKRAVVSRVRTLLVPFLILNMGYWLLNLFELKLGAMFFGKNGVPEVSVMTVLDVFGVTRDDPFHTVLWFVKQLMILVAVSPAIIFVLKRSLPLTLGIWFLVLCVACMTPRYSGVLVKAYPLFCFMGGIMLRECGKISCKPNARIALLFGSCGLSVQLVAELLLHWTVCREQIYHAIRMAFVVPLLSVGLWNLIPSRKWHSTLVGLSFPLYVLHTIVFHFWGTISRNVSCMHLPSLGGGGVLVDCHHGDGGFVRDWMVHEEVFPAYGAGRFWRSLTDVSQ